MDKIKEFDQKLIEKNDWEVLGSKVVKYILGGSGTFLMLLPFQEIRSDFKTGAFIIFMLLGMAVNYYLKPYMVVIENKKQVSIYDVLKFMPVSKMDIFKVRLCYLSKECVKYLVFGFFFQLTGAAINRQIDVTNILYPFCTIGIVFLSGLFYLIPPMQPFRFMDRNKML